MNQTYYSAKNEAAIAILEALILTYEARNKEAKKRLDSLRAVC